LVRSYQLLCGGWQIPLFDILTTEAKAGLAEARRAKNTIFNTALIKFFDSLEMRNGSI